MFVQTCEHTKRLIDAGLATSDDMYFMASIQRGTVTMTVHVAVGRDYPTSTPSLLLSVHCAGMMHTALNDEAVRVSHYHSHFTKADDTQDFCCTTLSCTKSCTSVIPFCRVLQQIAQQNSERNLLYFSAICCWNADLVYVQLLVIVTKSSPYFAAAFVQRCCQSSRSINAYQTAMYWHACAVDTVVASVPGSYSILFSLALCLCLWK